MVLWNDPAFFVFLTHFMGEFWRKGTHYMINKSNIEYYFVLLLSDKSSDKLINHLYRPL